MTILIFKKELMEQVTSFRFSLVWLLMLIIFTTSVVLTSVDMQQRLEYTDQVEASKERFLQSYAHTNRLGSIMQVRRPIEETELLFRGVGNPDQANSFFYDGFNKLMPEFDFIYLIAIIISLLSIIFTFDSICGEREKGTLKLIHTGSVTRFQVLFGKWLASIFVIAVPLILLFLFSLLFGSILVGASVTFSLMISVFLLAMAAIFYAAIFTGTGLLISSLVSRSSTAILVLLFVWVFWVLAVPNVSPLVAAQISPIPSVNQVEREIRALTDTTRDNRIAEEDNIIIARLRKEHSLPVSLIARWRRPEDLVALGWEQETAKKFIDDYSQEWNDMVTRVNEEQGAKASALRDELQRNIDLQGNLARSISYLSPTSAFKYAATDLTALGISAEEYIKEESERYSEGFYDFVDARQKQIEEDRANDPAWEGKNTRVGYNDFIDLSGHPVYRHLPQPLIQRIDVTLMNLFYLAVLAMIMLLAAHFAYQRYDIR